LTLYGNASDEVREGFARFAPTCLKLSAGFAR
jgi:hypothetical protein